MNDIKPKKIYTPVEPFLWSQLSDADKVYAIVKSSQKDPVNKRPSYAYLVTFIEAIADAYYEEKGIRRQVAFSNMIFMAAFLVMGIIAAIGWLR
jgi:hypothetical protein